MNEFYIDRRQMIHEMTKKRRTPGQSVPLTEEEQRTLEWLEAEELLFGGLFPGIDMSVLGYFL